jgi:hypothetical protein
MDIKLIVFYHRIEAFGKGKFIIIKEN